MKNLAAKHHLRPVLGAIVVVTTLAAGLWWFTRPTPVPVVVHEA